jgi:ribosomal protein L37AE/L43A
LLGEKREQQKSNNETVCPSVPVPEPVQRAVVDKPATPGPGACPKCGGLMVEIAANIRRCQQCGHQERFERERTIVPPIIMKPRPAAPAACPSCGSDLLQVISNGYRCQQCGCQITEGHATGLSRKDLENYTGPSPQAQMNGASFYRALARMRGLGRR